MLLTEIEFKVHDPLFQVFSEGISSILDRRIQKNSLFKGKITDSGNCKQNGWYHSDNYRIEFEINMKSTLEVSAVGMKEFGMSSEEMKETYDELLAYCLQYMAQEKINMFLSLNFYGFGDNYAEHGFRRGATSFIYSEGPYQTYPLTEELKEIRKTAEYMGKHFPIVSDGKYIITRDDKFRKEYQMDLVNQGGRVKIGVFLDELICTVESIKQVDDLVAKKKANLNELEKMKKENIDKLKKIDSAFQYDGKNGVVFMGSKATINTEYDQFKDEYLMVFLKSKVKAKTMSELQHKIDKLILKKTKK